MRNHTAATPHHACYAKRGAGSRGGRRRSTRIRGGVHYGSASNLPHCQAVAGGQAQRGHGRACGIRGQRQWPWREARQHLLQLYRHPRLLLEQRLELRQRESPLHTCSRQSDGLTQLNSGRAVSLSARSLQINQNAPLIVACPEGPLTRKFILNSAWMFCRCRMKMVAGYQSALRLAKLGLSHFRQKLAAHVPGLTSIYFVNVQLDVGEYLYAF